MTDQGFPVEDEILKPQSMSVFSFPVKSPVGALTRDKISAIDHLKIWQVYSDHWCEHKPSITVSVKENEWMEVGSYVYDSFSSMSGVSFLPMSEHTYKQAPFEDCSPEKYQVLLEALTKVDLTKVVELEDDTNLTGELACAGGVCEIV